MRLLPHALPAFLLLVACDGRRNGGEVPDGPAAGGTPPPVTHSPHRMEPPSRKATSLREALAAAGERPPSGERNAALAEIAWAAIELDPEVAREACSELAPGCPERIRLIQHCAMRMAETDLEAALAWADELGTGTEISAAKCQIAVVLSDRDPGAAARILAESGIEGRERDVAVVSVLQRWAATEPAEAAEWAAAFPGGSVRVAGIQAILSQWLARDAAAAFRWNQSVSDENLKEEIVSVLAGLHADRVDPSSSDWLRHADHETLEAVNRARNSTPQPDPPP